MTQFRLSPEQVADGWRPHERGNPDSPVPSGSFWQMGEFTVAGKLHEREISNEEHALFVWEHADAYRIFVVEPRPACPSCTNGAYTGLPGNACYDCMNTGYADAGPLDLPA